MSISIHEKVAVVASVDNNLFPFPIHDGWHPKNYKKTIFQGVIDEMATSGVTKAYFVVDFECDDVYKDRVALYGESRSVDVTFVYYHENQRNFVMSPLWQCLWCATRIYEASNKITRLAIPKEFHFFDLYSGFVPLVVETKVAVSSFRTRFREMKRLARKGQRKEILQRLSDNAILGDMEHEQIIVEDYVNWRKVYEKKP